MSAGSYRGERHNGHCYVSRPDSTALPLGPSLRCAGTRLRGSSGAMGAAVRRNSLWRCCWTWAPRWRWPRPIIRLSSGRTSSGGTRATWQRGLERQAQPLTYSAPPAAPAPVGAAPAFEHPAAERLPELNRWLVRCHHQTRSAPAVQGRRVTAQMVGTRAAPRRASRGSGSRRS